MNINEIIRNKRKMVGNLKVCTCICQLFTILDFQNWYQMKVVIVLLHSSQINKIRKRAKVRNRYNQEPHLTQDTNGKVTTSQLDITNESQEVNSFPAGDQKA